MSNKVGNPEWGGMRRESKVIKEIQDQWCRDNGYRITKRETKSGKAAPFYGGNVSKMRQTISTPRVSQGCRKESQSVELRTQKVDIHD
tara:strand:+ start:361 stop:624 length:264 start_codon:yes stop_codon:yes gene_type:complete